MPESELYRKGAEMRRQLPDGPGVYPFKDRRGRVLYVGKASSIRKRVGSHFSKPATRALPASGA